jgi:hypothetical protein
MRRPSLELLSFTCGSYGLPFLAAAISLYYYFYSLWLNEKTSW